MKTGMQSRLIYQRSALKKIILTFDKHNVVTLFSQMKRGKCPK
jgi:hypothetical protein